MFIEERGQPRRVERIHGLDRLDWPAVSGPVTSRYRVCPSCPFQ
jgi:hypothetical protein